MADVSYMMSNAGDNRHDWVIYAHAFYSTPGIFHMPRGAEEQRKDERKTVFLL